MPLSWKNAPTNTKAFVMLMTTLPGDGTTKWNWIIYNIPAATARLTVNTAGVGVLGAADDGAGNAYAPPCSQGPGAKIYTFTLYAVSDVLAFSQPVNQVTGNVVTDALKSVTLATSVLNMSYTRNTTAPVGLAATNCAQIQTSTAPWATSVSVDCSATDYAKVGSVGIPSHTMMNGVTATNLQVPLAQAFTGTNAWKIPLAPVIASGSTSVTDGPVGVAVNGVPIFNPCKQGGCQNGDTKVLGELDICNGHAGRADDYHYHAAPNCLMVEAPASYWDT
ncbi:MAG: YHYH protein, partial [Alphaproteobacteria bacterium]|nr:YHYH protein [Alphaproteobacteria bacterium]